jgi:hypothetical protein
MHTLISALDQHRPPLRLLETFNQQAQVKPSQVTNQLLALHGARATAEPNTGIFRGYGMV